MGRSLSLYPSPKFGGGIKGEGKKECEKI